MKYSVEYLVENKEQNKFLFFWGHQPSKKGDISASCLSQWWKASFELEEETFQTTEHWMMAQKARLFEDMDSYDRILKASTPAQAKKLGRMVTNFQPDVWDAHKYQIVVKGNFLKFSQNTKLKEYLIGTNNRVLVEASPVDAIWGIGLAADHTHAKTPVKWRGQNLLGFALMEVRDLLKELK